MILTAKNRSQFQAYVMNTRNPDSCWPWIGWSNGNYGYFSINKKNYRAHRVAYFLEYGIDPGNSCVCHRCDNPICCNPRHLFLGTHQSNMQDAAKKGRQSKRNNGAKLTENDVIEIKRLLYSGLPQIDISKRFNVSEAAIIDIKLKRTWSHVQ